MIISSRLDLRAWKVNVHQLGITVLNVGTWHLRISESGCALRNKSFILYIHFSSDLGILRPVGHMRFCGHIRLFGRTCLARDMSDRNTNEQVYNTTVLLLIGETTTYNVLL